MAFADRVIRLITRVMMPEEDITDENLSSDEEASNKTFPQFRQLLVEIRRAIWGASLPAPRVFEPKDDDDELQNYEEGKPTRFIQEWAPPKMRGACREAYAVCMSSGRFTFGWFKNSSIRGLWFNDKHDAVYFAHYRQWDFSRVLGVQTVYVGTEIALTELTRRGFGHDNLTACRRLVVALHPKMIHPIGDVTLEDLPGTKPVFRAMKDDDSIGPHKLDTVSFPEVAGKEFLTWGDLKSVLQKTRQQALAANAEKPGFYRGPIQMEAVEVFRAPDDREGLM